MGSALHLLEEHEISTPEVTDECLIREMIDHVMELHRHGDAQIVFGRKDASGALRHTDGFRASTFRHLFPQFAAQFLSEGYVSVNASISAGGKYQPGNKAKHLLFESTHVNPVNRYTGRSFHREIYLRRLNSCYVDVDCYKINELSGSSITPNDVREELDRLCSNAEIPIPQKISFSGRGLWIYWFLHDPKNPTQSHLGCQPDVINRYKDINRALSGKFARFGADFGAIDAARLTGLHGTFKSKSKATVHWVNYPGGKSYSLSEIEDLLKIKPVRGVGVAEPQRCRKCAPKDIPEEVSRRCARGWLASAQYRIKHFEQLRAIRGKFYEGQRDHAAFIYAGVLRSAHYSEEAATVLVREFGENHCSDPLSFSQCDVRVRSAYSEEKGADGKLRRRKSLTYQAMADTLDVTLEESLEMSKEVGTYFPPRAGAGELIVPPGQKEKTLIRQTNLTEIVDMFEALGAGYTYDDIHAEFENRRIIVSRGSIFNDLKKLAKATPRMRKQKLPKQAEQTKSSMRLASNW